MYLIGGTITGGTYYHNTEDFHIGDTTGTFGLILEDQICFGSVASAYLTNAHDITLDTLTVNGTAEQGTSAVVLHYAVTGLKLYSCDFATASGIKIACAADIAYSNESGVPYFGGVNAYNTKFALSTNPVSGGGGNPSSYLISIDHNQTDGAVSEFYKYGTVVKGTNLATLTPNSASKKLAYKILTANCEATNGTITFSVTIEKSADYNGNQPRLIVIRNDGMGIAVDTVLDTYDAVGLTQTLTGTTAALAHAGGLSVKIDCDGTVGTIKATSATGTYNAP
jgi:hypothetical protein